MPDITLPYVFVASTPAEPQKVLDDFYRPHQTTPVSLEVVDGWLNQANLAAGTVIGSQQIQPRTLANGRTVAANAPLDYNDWVFQSSGAGQEPVPGATLTFELPYAPSLLVLSWEISMGAQLDVLLPPGIMGGTDFSFRFDSVQPPAHTFTAPPACFVVGVPASRRYRRDRLWAGRWMSTSAGSGWHTASISLKSSDRATRVRCRHMQAVWFR
jgi:hypothetical protein